MIETCPYSPQISAYHDGELSAEARLQLEQHLSSNCPACALELQQWRRLSALLSAGTPALPAAAKAKLYRLAPTVREASFIRLAEWTTALAASVLIAVSAWMVINQKSSAPPANQPANWQTVALATTNDVDSSSQAEPQFVDYVVNSYAAAGNKGHE